MAVVHARSWRVVYACLFGVASRSVTPVMVDLWSPFSSISHLAQLRSAEQEAPAVVGGGGDAVHRCPVRAGGDAAAAQHFHACEQALTKGSDESALLVGTLPRGTVPERGGRRQRHTPLLHPGDDGSNARRHASVVAFCDT